MVDAIPKVAVLDHPFGVGDGGNAAVVVADHVDDLGLFGRRDHLLAFLHVHRQRLLAKNRLAAARRLDGDLAMAVVGRADVDDMNFRVA